MKNHGNQPNPKKNHETTSKQKLYQRMVKNDLGGGQGRKKQKRDWRGVTTDLLDV